MTMIDVYFGIASVVVVAIGVAIIMIVRRSRKDVPLNMPKTEGDPLLDSTVVTPLSAEISVGRWGDEIIGKPKIISTETAEERVTRLHQEAEQLQAQQQLSQTRQPSAYAPRAIHVKTQSSATIVEEQAQHNTIMILYVMAPERRHFNGYELYQSLINAGLTYGKMRIFHYHQKQDSQSPILFSVASAINPGTIDLDQIGSFSTPGLTLFLDTRRTPNSKIVLETMIAVAEQLADDLEGTVLNSKHQLWSSAVETECYTQL